MEALEKERHVKAHISRTLLHPRRIVSSATHRTENTRRYQPMKRHLWALFIARGQGKKVRRVFVITRSMCAMGRRNLYGNRYQAQFTRTGLVGVCDFAFALAKNAHTKRGFFARRIKFPECRSKCRSKLLGSPIVFTFYGKYFL